MKPDLEVVQIGSAESFKVREHGYPYHTVRWHFHPQYELHHVVATAGRCFVGDHVGSFEPGQLVLTGPNLPHNWVSDVPDGACVPLRGRFLQFSERFIGDVAALFPELAPLDDVLARSRRGMLYPPSTGASVGALLAELVHAKGIARLQRFMAILEQLTRAAPQAVELASAAYHPDPSGFMAAGINRALDHINRNLTESFGETDLARISGLSTGAFSRSFRRHTGMTLSQYVSRLRIHLACQLLMSDDALPITDICFASGFTNLSNFNRQFLRQKGMPPSRFRAMVAGATGATGATGAARSVARTRSVPVPASPAMALT